MIFPASSSDSRMVDVEELLIEIFVPLPPNCLPRFQLVSKKWFFIISIRLHTCRLPAAVTGLFFAHPRKIPPFLGPLFVSLKGPDKNPKRTHKLAYRLNGVCGGGPIVSLNSCNGLLCIWSLDENGSNKFFVYNPTTNQRRRIPNPFPHRKRYEISAMNIAFDPSKSHHYNLVCAYKYYTRKRCEKIGFYVFSSESRVWRESAEQLTIVFDFRNKPGAFLNGPIHWYNYVNIFLRFEVDNAWFRPMPPSPLTIPGRGVYFGECGGHLHFVELPRHGSKLLNVFEMENDYSRWIFKYQVHLTHHMDDFSSIAMYGVSTIRISIHFFVVDNEGKEGLVISFSRKLILYHLHDMSITQLTIWPELFNNGIYVRANYNHLVANSLGDHSTCKHIETLAYV